MFKKIMLDVFWPYGTINEEPSVIKKWLKYLYSVIAVICTVWFFAFVLLLPAWFSEKHVINGHVIYSSKNMDSEWLQNVLDITKEKIKKSAINVPKSLPTIYLYKNNIFFNISLPDFFANTTTLYGPFSNRIHIRLSDLYTNGIINQNWLSVLIAHEKTHSLLVERYGILTYTLLIPRWVSEGYAEYVSHDHAPPDEDYKEWLRRINAGESINKYFESWVLVRHAIDEMGYSVDVLHNGEVDREVVEQSFLNWAEKKLKQEVKNE